VDTRFRLDGKVAVVTGANGLLGRHHVTALEAAGATVIAVDIDVDVTSESSLEELRSSILSTYGRLDIIVNNAAVNDMVENPVSILEASRFENSSVELFRRVLDVNVTGVYLCCRILGSILAEQGSGSIINIGSTYGTVAPNQSLYINEQGEQTFFKSAVYPVSKGAVRMLTRFLASYWGHRGVRVNTLSPGGVANNQPDWFYEQYAKSTPLRRMAEANDYEGALVFLASDASAYLTGHDLVVDGGYTIW